MFPRRARALITAALPDGPRERLDACENRLQQSSCSYASSRSRAHAGQRFKPAQGAGKRQTGHLVRTCGSGDRGAGKRAIASILGRE